MKNLKRITKVLLRIMLQALVPILLMDCALLFVYSMMHPDFHWYRYFQLLSRDNIVDAQSVLFIAITVFGFWFHFINPIRFAYIRHRKGLYQEYIKWFNDDTR